PYQTQENLPRHDLPPAGPARGLRQRGAGPDRRVWLPLRAAPRGGAPRPPDLQRMRTGDGVLRAGDRSAPGRSLRAVRLSRTLAQPPAPRDLQAMPPPGGPPGRPEGQ